MKTSELKLLLFWLIFDCAIISTSRYVIYKQLSFHKFAMVLCGSFMKAWTNTKCDLSEEHVSVSVDW